MKVEDIMTRDVVTCNLEATAKDAAKLMTDKNVGSVVVVEEGQRVVGIVVDRQIVTDVIGPGKDPANVRVREFMTENPITCRTDQDIMAACALVKEHKFRRTPVVDANDKLVGVLSIADVALAAEPLLNAVLEEVGRSVNQVKVRQSPEKMQMLATRGR